MDIPLSKFDSSNELHRFVDERFYDPQEFKITKNRKKYLEEIIQEIPLKKYGLNNLQWMDNNFKIRDSDLTILIL